MEITESKLVDSITSEIELTWTCSCTIALINRVLIGPNRDIDSVWIQHILVKGKERSSVDRRQVRGKDQQ